MNLLLNIRDKALLMLLSMTLVNLKGVSLQTQKNRSLLEELPFPQLESENPTVFDVLEGMATAAPTNKIEIEKLLDMEKKDDANREKAVQEDSTAVQEPAAAFCNIVGQVGRYLAKLPKSVKDFMRNTCGYMEFYNKHRRASSALEITKQAAEEGSLQGKKDIAIKIPRFVAEPLCKIIFEAGRMLNFAPEDIKNITRGVCCSSDALAKQLDDMHPYASKAIGCVK